MQAIRGGVLYRDSPWLSAVSGDGRALPVAQLMPDHVAEQATGEAESGACAEYPPPELFERADPRLQVFLGAIEVSLKAIQGRDDLD